MAEAILKRIAEGDAAAVQDCLKKYGGLVWSLARRMLRNSDDAEDAVQEIFVDVWKNAARFDEAKSSETTFIAMIARRRLIDKIRYATRRISADSLDDVLLEPFTRADKTLETMHRGRTGRRGDAKLPARAAAGAAALDSPGNVASGDLGRDRNAARNGQDTCPARASAGARTHGPK